MKPAAAAKPFLIIFLVVLAFYLGSFHGLEFLRHRKGPWQLEFGANNQSEPTVIIRQPANQITNLTLIFHGEKVTNNAGTASFAKVKQSLPFGRLLYEDLTFLPGVLTFDFYGHEIEVLPRVLVVNKREFPWQSGTTIDLWPTNKPATPPQPPKQKG